MEKETESGQKEYIDIDSSLSDLNFVGTQYDEKLNSAATLRYEERIEASWSCVDGNCHDGIPQKEAQKAFGTWFKKVQFSNPEWQIVRGGAIPLGQAACKTITSAPFPVGDGKSHCTGTLSMSGWVEFIT